MNPALKLLRSQLIEAARTSTATEFVDLLWALAATCEERQIDLVSKWEVLCIDQLINLIERRREGGRNRSTLGVRLQGKHDHQWFSDGLQDLADRLLLAMSAADFISAVLARAAEPDEHSAAIAMLISTTVSLSRNLKPSIQLGAAFEAFAHSNPMIGERLLTASAPA